MALPTSRLPLNVNSSFAALGAEGGMTRAQEIYFKHHPAVYQKALYERLLASEQYKQQTDAAKLQLLQKQLGEINNVLARYRETGAGPSGTTRLATGFAGGRAAGGGGGGGGGGGSPTAAYLGFVSDVYGIGVEKEQTGVSQQVLAEKELEKLDRTPVQFASFNQGILTGLDRDRRAGSTKQFDLPVLLLSKYTENVERLAGGLEQATPYQRKKAAAEMYMGLRQRFPSILSVPGAPLTVDAQVVLATLDDIYGTGGFLINTLMTGQEPLFKVEEERQRIARGLSAAAGVSGGRAEEKALELLDQLPFAEKDTNKDGVVSPEENAAALKKVTAQARKELGIAEPLSDEEALLISRYVGMLSDDGRVSADEKEKFGTDFDKAKAAFEKGSRVENLPRGLSPFYDQTYLDLLAERADLRKKIEGTTGVEGTPEQRAARGTLGLSTIDAATLESASTAAGTPLAGETMPFAIARYNKAGGVINPESDAERVAQRIIDANQTPISFLAFVAQVNKRFPGDELARRDAMAYYGAYYRAQKDQTETLKPQTTPQAPSPTEAPFPTDAPLADETTPTGRLGKKLREVERKLKSRFPFSVGEEKIFSLTDTLKTRVGGVGGSFEDFAEPMQEPLPAAPGPQVSGAPRPPSLPPQVSSAPPLPPSLPLPIGSDPRLPPIAAQELGLLPTSMPYSNNNPLGLPTSFGGPPLTDAQMREAERRMFLEGLRAQVEQQRKLVEARGILR